MLPGSSLVAYSSSEAGSSSPEPNPITISNIIQEDNSVIPSNSLSLRISGSAPMSNNFSNGSNSSNNSSNSNNSITNNSINIKNSFQQQQNQNQQQRNNELTIYSSSSTSDNTVNNLRIQGVNQSTTEVTSTPSFLSRLSLPLNNNNNDIKSSPTSTRTSLPPPITSSLNSSNSNSRLRDSMSSLDAEGEIDSEEEDTIVGVGNSLIPGAKRETLALDPSSDPFRRRSSVTNDPHPSRPILLNTISPTSIVSNLPSTSTPSLPTSSITATPPSTTTAIPAKREKYKLTLNTSGALNIKGVAGKNSKPSSRNSSLNELPAAAISPSASTSSLLDTLPIAVVEKIIVKEAPVEEVEQKKVEVTLPDTAEKKAVEVVAIVSSRDQEVERSEEEENVVEEPKLVEIPKAVEEQKVEVALPLPSPPVVVKASMLSTSESLQYPTNVIKSPIEEGEILSDISTTATPLVPTTSLPQIPVETAREDKMVVEKSDFMDVDEPEEGEVVISKPVVAPRPSELLVRPAPNLAERLSPLPPQPRSPTPPRPIRVQTPLSIPQAIPIPYLSPADTRKLESQDSQRRVNDARASRAEEDKFNFRNRSSSHDSNPSSSRYPAQILNYGKDSRRKSIGRREQNDQEDASARRTGRNESSNGGSRASGSNSYKEGSPASSRRERSRERDQEEYSSRKYREGSTKSERDEERERERKREDDNDEEIRKARREKRKASEDATTNKRPKSSTHDSPRRSSKHSSRKETPGEPTSISSTLPKRLSSQSPTSPTLSAGSRDRGVSDETDSHLRRKDSTHDHSNRDTRSRSPTRYRSPVRNERDDRGNRGYDDSRRSRSLSRGNARSRSPPRGNGRSRSPMRTGGNNFDDRESRNYDNHPSGGGRGGRGGRGYGTVGDNRSHNHPKKYVQNYQQNWYPNNNNNNGNKNNGNNYHNNSNNHNNPNKYSSYNDRNTATHYEPDRSFTPASHNYSQPLLELSAPRLPTPPPLTTPTSIAIPIAIPTAIPATIPLPAKPAQYEVQKEPPPRNKSISKPQAQIINLGAQHIGQPEIPTGPKEKKFSISFPKSKIPIKAIPKETTIPEEPYVHPTELLPIIGLPSHPSLIISSVKKRPPLSSADEEFKLARDQQAIKPWNYVDPGSSLSPAAALYSQSIPVASYDQPSAPLPSIPIPTIPQQLPVNPAFHRLISPNSASSSSAGPSTPNNRTPQRERLSQIPPPSNKPLAPYPPTWNKMLDISGWLEPPSSEEVRPLLPKRDSSGLSERVYVGTSKIGEYTLQQKLGEGTFGLVYKGIRGKAEPNGKKAKKMTPSEQAREDKLIQAGSLVKNGDVVALKEIILHNAGDGMPITSLREIRILKSLKHPNIVPVVDIAFEEGDRETFDLGKTYMVFPYMEHDLTGLLENTQVTLKEEHVKQYATQLLLGTHYLHKNGIIHRDIKAANLLISNAGVLMIADFGLARSLTKGEPDQLYTNCVVTRWYRPPELLLGAQQYGTAVDMWGVGCVIAEMFKRTPILPGSSDIDQAHRIFELCGNPTSTSMPGWERMLSPEMRGINFKPSINSIRIKYEQYGTNLVELLKRFLVLDPDRRVTALDALDDQWFWDDPLPTPPHKMPRYNDSHEFDKRLREESMNPSLHARNQRPTLPASNAYQPPQYPQYPQIPQPPQPLQAYATQLIYASGFNQVPAANNYSQNHVNPPQIYQAPAQQQYAQQQRYSNHQGNYSNPNYNNHGNNSNFNSNRGGTGGFNNRNNNGWQSNGNSAAAGGGGRVNLNNMLEARPGGASSSTYGVPTRPSNQSQPPLDPRASTVRKPYDT